MELIYKMLRWIKTPADQNVTHINTPIHHWNDAFPGIKRLLFNLVVFISIAGNILDMHNVGHYTAHYVNYINLIYIVLAASVFLLERLGTIPLHCSTNVIIYAIVINILSSINVHSEYFAEVYMRETIFIGISLIIAGIINRNNIIILSTLYFVHFFAVLYITRNAFLMDNALLMLSVLFSYVVLVYYILKLFQSSLISQHNLTFQLNETNKSLDEQRKQLEESEMKYRMLAENAGDFIATFNKSGNFTYTSPSVAKILGYGTAELIDRNALNLVHADDLKTVKQSMARTIQGTESVCQYRARKKDGRYVWVEALMQKINSIENRYITIIRDISLRKTVQLELEKANQTKDKFFSIIAHDLKSPMSQIYSSSHLLDEKGENMSAEDKSLLVKNLFDGSEKLSSLLDDLLLWSRSQMNKIPITPEQCNVTAIVGECIELFSNSLSNKHIKVSINTEQAKLAYVDVNSVKTVIRNILSNAIKFSYPNSVIAFSVLEIQENIHLEIIDNGIGISKERITSLFEIDKSSSTPGTQEETGTGLGIIICKELIEKNKGRLLVESELNKGTTFHVILPAFPSLS